MKKICVSILVVCIIMTIFGFTSCLYAGPAENSSDESSEVGESETSISVETDEMYLILSGYKTEFYIGEDFSAGEIVVLFKKGNSETVLTQDEYEIDFSSFDKNVSGDYIITVYYQNQEVELEYTVTVKERDIVRDEENESVWGKDLWL